MKSMIGVGLFALCAFSVYARAEIDERDVAGTVGPTAVNTRAEDRTDLRNALGASERAQVSRSSRAPQQTLTVGALPPVYENGTTPQVGTQVLVQSQSSADSGATVDNASRSEMMRRTRVREEIQNEDELQERLESLRLRDERSRIGTIHSGWDQAEHNYSTPTQSAPMQTEVVGRTSLSNAETVEMLTQAEESRAEAHEKTAVYLQGRGGVAMMGSQGDGYNVNGRYSLGIGLGFMVSSNFSVEAGYAFNEYGVELSGYPYYGYPQGSGGSTLTGANETYAMKQNVVDLGLKFHVLGPDSRLRPFVNAGAAYSKSFVNYDERIQQQQAQYQNGYNPYAQDFEMSSFLGFAGAGLDVRVSKTVAIGGAFRYYGVLSARENQPSNENSPYGYNYYYQPEKQQLGAALAKRSFYTLVAGLTFVF